MKIRKITDQAIQSFKELREKGWTLHSIANKFKIHHTTVYYRLKRIGITKPKKLIRKPIQRYVPSRKYTKIGKSYQDYLDAQKKPDAVEKARKDKSKNFY